jgi:two-component system, chemotaxis family, protein-glutamate methylesterase/glutaminase
MSERITVIIVDDSAVVRQALSGVLQKAADIEVIAVAADPLFALEKMRKRWPDVVITDVEMPRMDGIRFVQQIMAERPTPVVVCSSLTAKGAETTLQVLAAGALSVVTKPRMGVKSFLEDASQDLIAAVRAAARANRGALRPVARAEPVPQKHDASVILPATGVRAMARTTERIVAIGTSTGGTQALEVVLTALPRVCPGIVVVQHMPEQFTASFAARLDSLCEMEVREARDGDRIAQGRVLIAPGGKHMLVHRSGAYYQVEVRDGPLVNRHRPSVDVLFRSTAQHAGRNALGIIMTGMGDDGARGLRELHDAGAATIAQDEASCVVYGMPREAVRMGGVDRSVPLQGIAREITGFS